MAAIAVAAPITIAAASLIVAPSQHGPSSHAPSPDQTSPTTLRDVAYRTGPDFVPGRHTLDLFIPVERPYPIVHFVHGGGWTGGDKQAVPGEYYENVAQALVEEGFAVSLVNYRLSDGSPDSVMHPEHARDVAHAIAFAGSLLIARGGRASAHFVMGHDAGAHLAALVATNPRFLGEHGLDTGYISGVIGLSGVYAIPPLDDSWSEVFGRDPLVRVDASPIRFVEHASAAFSLMFGDDDLPGRADEAARFADALSGAGVDVTSVRVAGRDHPGIVRRFGQTGDPVAARVIDFVRRIVPTPVASTLTPTPVASPTPSPSGTPTETPAPTPTSSSHVPPGQAPRGPGGAERHFATTRVVRGPGWRSVLPDPPSGELIAPIVFVPDLDATGEPGPYERWLDHLARGGWAVIVPSVAGASEGGVDAVHAAAGDAIDDLERRTALDGSAVIWAGHGTGATTAAILAAEWFERRLPPPRGLLVIAPRRHDDALPWLGPPFIPNDTRTAFIALADAPNDDPFIEPALWRAAARVPGRFKTRITLNTDRYGQPWLVADAHTPFTEAPGRLDALDWRGTWRVLDALAACSTTSLWCETIFGDPAVVEDMGRWSDGRPVEAARVSEGPPAAPWIQVLLPAVGASAE